jgi:hypothetical protein
MAFLIGAGRPQKRPETDVAFLLGAEPNGPLHVILSALAQCHRAVVVFRQHPDGTLAQLQCARVPSMENGNLGYPVLRMLSDKHARIRWRPLGD